ncbi:carbonic anhydrase [Salirhabdus euzebyi]|uniref:carbonic anhydrase n=1 Tax=Salirhabdus euzebyi TaxID=394506 RepID=A0A841Q2X4_9BACI|nr:carbonic anhydrase [Salirhabdus euzebyi]MBB6451818.1 carbonic anhydrase [Salirhabdus euzebyi]
MLLDEILTFNTSFVENKEYEPYQTERYPNKKLVILSCMDTRLVELLPKAMNVRNGDVKIIKNAGAIISSPYGSVVRSILISLYELRAEEVMIVGHHNCGMANIDPNSIIQKMQEHGVTEEAFKQVEQEDINLQKWLTGFDNVEESVKRSVDKLRTHPLFPKSTPIHGLVINPSTGKLQLIDNGYEYST